MIEVLFSRINQLTNKLIRIGKTTGNDLYGNGTRGSVYYGIGTPTTDKTFDRYHILTADSSGNAFAPIPCDSALYYTNLYIDTNVTLYGISDSVSIFVNDTLTLKGNISLDNTHDGAYSIISENIKVDTKAKLLLRAETQFLPTAGFFCTGGSGNPAFGNAAHGGGLAGVYYGSVNEYDPETDNKGRTISQLDFTNRIDVSASNQSTSSLSKLGKSSGGCLFITARHILLDTGTHIYNRGMGTSGSIADGCKFAYKLGVY